MNRGFWHLVLFVATACAGIGSSSSRNRTAIPAPLVALMIATRAASAMRTASTALRRSPRLRGLSKAGASPSVAAAAGRDPDFSPPPAKKTKRTRSAAAAKKTKRSRSTAASGATPASGEGEKKRGATKKTKKAGAKTTSARGKTKESPASAGSARGGADCLPRTEETRLLSETQASGSKRRPGGHPVRFVMGVDEAGRGPLAGPVVAAAAIVPVDLDGITDSKKITREEQREDLYAAITESEGVRWAVAVMDAPFIDRVNILQATLRGMAAAATALAVDNGDAIVLGEDLTIPIVPGASIEQKGCYVVTNGSSSSSSTKNNGKDAPASAEDYYALIDGNRVPPDMPCESTSIVKGDGREYCIAAASILAKVTRDRLMRGYHELWPHYGLEQHKGYPTAAHMRAVKTHGASPIHRRTFRPLKDMAFDEDGNIVAD